MFALFLYPVHDDIELVETIKQCGQTVITFKQTPDAIQKNNYTAALSST